MSAPLDHKRRFLAAIRAERLDIGDAARRAGLTFREERISDERRRAILAEAGLRDPLAAKTVAGAQPTE